MSGESVRDFVIAMVVWALIMLVFFVYFAIAAVMS